MAQTTTSAPQQQTPMPAVDLRQLLGSLVSAEGVRTSTDLVVAQRGAGANMSVDVSAGSAVIQDDHASGGGFYSYTLAATTNVAVTGSDPTNPRVDRVVVRVRDQALGDAANDATVVVIAGTPTSGATLVNLNGAAAVPGSSLLLANVLVPNASSSVTTANIGNVVAILKGIGAGMTQIYDSTLGSTSATIDVSSIAGSYAHLRIEIYARTDAADTGGQVSIRFNNDSAANYDYQYAGGTAATAQAGESFAATSAGCGLTAGNSGPANTFSPTVIDIPHYANAANHKTFLTASSFKVGTTTGSLVKRDFTGYWRSTVAINRITLLPPTGNFNVGTRVTIYGLN